VRRELTIERLRADHDYFMHQLARAVEKMRMLLNVSEQLVIVEGLAIVKDTISEIEQKLADHNQIEEKQIYAVWLQRPATRVYWWRGWKLYLQPERFVQNTECT
jgi:hypothetical protein